MLMETFKYIFIILGYFEYELVAVVANEAPIHSAQELRGTRLCHPGHGLQQSHITEILANVSDS